MSRHNEQVESAGGNYPTIFDKNKIPEGRKFWKPTKGDHIIDIIPFFAGPNHPRVSEGEVSYVLDLYVHNGIGPKREPFVCKAKNFQQTDPICDWIARNRLSTEEWKKFSPKRRTVYLVWVHDDEKEEAKGLQIWEVAHFFFESHVDEIAKSPRGGGAVVFSDVDTGKSIAFSIKVSGKYTDGNGKERDSLIYVGHRFVDREEAIPDEILEQSFPLDSIVKMNPSDEEMETALNFMIDGPITKKKSSFAKPLKEEIKEEDIDVFDEEEEEEEDFKKNEDEEEPKEINESEKSECPHSKFGEGFDNFDDCTFCDLYDECADEFEKAKIKKSLKRKK